MKDKVAKLEHDLVEAQRNHRESTEYAGLLRQQLQCVSEQHSKLQDLLSSQDGDHVADASKKVRPSRAEYVKAAERLADATGRTYTAPSPRAVFEDYCREFDEFMATYSAYHEISPKVKRASHRNGP